MVISYVGEATTQLMASTPVPVFDAGMNLMGYLRGMGVSLNNNLTLIIDAFFKSEEGKEEYEEYIKLVREAFEKGTGISSLKSFLKLYKKEVPDVFESRRIYLEVTDPEMDMCMGVGGIRLNIIWDYEQGRFSMFYLPPLDMVDELNTKINHYLAITRGLMGTIREMETLRAENWDLRIRVGQLERTLHTVLSSAERRVKEIADAQRSLLEMKLREGRTLTKEEVEEHLNNLKAVIQQTSTWYKENLNSIMSVRMEALDKEAAVMGKLKVLIDTVKSMTEMPLTEEQIFEILTDAIAKNPEWVRSQLERYRRLASAAPIAIPVETGTAAGETGTTAGVGPEEVTE